MNHNIATFIQAMFTVVVNFIIIVLFYGCSTWVFFMMYETKSKQLILCLIRCIEVV